MAVHRLQGLAKFLAFLVLGVAGCRFPAATSIEANASQRDRYPNAWEVLQLAPADTASSPIDIADPHVIRDRNDGRWILYATHVSNAIHAWTSSDLQNWTHAGAVWMAPTTTTAWNRIRAWAPNVIRGTDGYWYLYYSANYRIGVARAADPLGPFQDLRPVPLVGQGYAGVGDGQFSSSLTDPDTTADFDEFAIDAFLLDTAQRKILYFTRYTPFSIIAAVELSDYAAPLSETLQTVAEPSQSWEAGVMEGSWVDHVANRFVFTYSGHFAPTANYAIGAGSMPDDMPFGPLNKNEMNPILSTSRGAQVWGPGHHSIAPGIEDGDELLFFHTKVSDHTGYVRRIRYVPVRRDESGIPTPAWGP